MIHPLPASASIVLLLAALSSIPTLSSIPITYAGWASILAKAASKAGKENITSQPSQASSEQQQQTCASQLETLSNNLGLANAYGSGQPYCTNGYTFTCDYSTMEAQVESVCTSLGGSTYTADFSATFQDYNGSFYSGSYSNVGICFGYLCDATTAAYIYDNYLGPSAATEVAGAGYYNVAVQRASEISLRHQRSGSRSISGDGTLVLVLVVVATSKTLFVFI